MLPLEAAMWSLIRNRTENIAACFVGFRPLESKFDDTVDFRPCLPTIYIPSYERLADFVL